MPKPYGFTKKGKLEHWLRHNPGLYRTSFLARQHNISRTVVLNTLRELEANGKAEKWLSGRNTKWKVF